MCAASRPLPSQQAASLLSSWEAVAATILGFFLSLLWNNISNCGCEMVCGRYTCRRDLRYAMSFPHPPLGRNQVPIKQWLQRVITHMVVLTLIESHMWHLLVSTFRSKKMSHLTTRPGYIPVQVGLQYVSLIALMPEPLRCTKNDLVRQFCLHTQNHSWLTTHKSKACASPMWPHDTQQFATCDKLNRVSAHRSQKRRCATVGRVQQRLLTRLGRAPTSAWRRDSVFPQEIP